MAVKDGYWDERYKADGPIKTVGTVRWTQATWDKRRDAVLREVIRPLLGGRGIGTIADIGCGPGRFMEPLLTVADYYVGFDIAQEAINLANEMLENHPYYDETSAGFYQKDDFRAPARTWDAVFTCTALQHIVDDEELALCIKCMPMGSPKGFRWVSVESVGPQVARHEHIKFRPPEQYIEMFAAAGLKAIHVMDFYDCAVFCADKE